MAMTSPWPRVRSDLEAAAHVTTAFDRWVSMTEGAVVDIRRGSEFASRMAEINDYDVVATGRCDAGEAVTVSDGRPARAAVHVSADPAAWLLVGYRRRSRWWAATTGKVVAWGPEPWLAFRTGRLLAPA